MMQSQSDDKPATGTVLARLLADHSPSVAFLLRGHLEDNDEILPTLFLGEVEKWFELACQNRISDPDDFADAIAVTQVLGDVFLSGDDAVRNLIAVGFVEMLLDLTRKDRDCIDELPDSLRSELERMKSWSPKK